MENTGVVIVAAGSGTRMGMETSKVLLPLAETPILLHSLRKFKQFPWVAEIVVVVREKDYEQVCTLLEHEDIDVTLVVGGARRQDSVAAGLKALSPELPWVMIHDAARPLVTTDCIAAAYAGVQQYAAVSVAVPVKDTIKIVNEKQIVLATPPREQLWAVQTPQAFSASLLRAAYAQAEQEGWEVTDDCSLIEKYGYKVKLIPGEYTNLKITTPDDLPIAEALLRNKGEVRTEMRIGFGYDVHRLVPDRPLVLGGVPIVYPLGLLGHSDADVVVHALMDALLGAASLGDIGQHFPDTDPAYRGISSIKLLVEVTKLLAQHHYRVGNVDLTIVAEKPKLAPYIEQMRIVLADTMQIPLSLVSIKATTTEGLGFCGRQEGIAAYAVVTLVKVVQ